MVAGRFCFLPTENGSEVGMDSLFGRGQSRGPVSGGAPRAWSPRDFRAHCALGRGVEKRHL